MLIAMMMAMVVYHLLVALALQCSCASAFVAPSLGLGRSRLASSIPLRHSLEDEDDEDECHEVTRRALFRATAAMGAASLLKPTSVGASTSTVLRNPSPSAIVSKTLCDPSVSTWVKAAADGNPMRTVHILGTAHVSSSSAELAGRMVREIKPTVVFVELDAKRVERAIPGGLNATGDGITSLKGLATTSDTAGSSGSITSTPDNTSNSERSNKFEAVGSKYVGNAVKGMYSKLEGEGFQAGAEFAMAIREGLILGSTIVLGDRDVEVTLRRLTKALTKTDFRKLLAADSEVNSSMDSLLPEGVQNQIKGGAKDIRIEKAEFQTFIESMKAKENVKNIMNGLRQTAPEIYNAMVAERDEYMARGLDELDDNLKGNNLDKTVAVMGMAHVDGVERYLESKGWNALTYPCPVVS